MRARLRLNLPAMGEDRAGCGHIDDLGLGRSRHFWWISFPVTARLELRVLRNVALESSRCASFLNDLFGPTLNPMPLFQCVRLMPFGAISCSLANGGRAHGLRRGFIRPKPKPATFQRRL